MRMHARTQAEAAPKRRRVERDSDDDLVEGARRILKTLSPRPIGDMPLASPFARIEEGKCPWVIGREVHEETRLCCLTRRLVRDKDQIKMGKLGELVREGQNGSRIYRLTEKTSRAFESATDDEWDSFDYVTRLEWMSVAGAYNQQAHAQYGNGTPFKQMTGYDVYCEQWPKVVSLAASQPTNLFVQDLVRTGDDECSQTRWNAMPAEMRTMYGDMADDRNAWRFLKEHGERETWGYNPFRGSASCTRVTAAVWIQAAFRGHRVRAFPKGRVAKTSDGSVHFYRGPRDRERRFRVERANGNVEHYVPSETHRADGRRLYSEWPNRRIDLYDGPDDNRRCVHSIHPDGCRDHYEGDAGEEVRTRRDFPNGRVQIFAVDGAQKQYVKEERWPRSGLRRVYRPSLQRCTETFGPKSEPEWVFCSRREQIDATTTELKEAWGPYEDDERKRAVALGRAVIKSLGVLSTDELVAQIATVCGDEETTKAMCDKQEAEAERDSQERKRMSAALYKRVVARISSTNACPKDVRLRVGLQVHAAFMDMDAHPNLAGLLRGPPEAFDAVFDTLLTNIVTAELEAKRAELKAKCAERDELAAENAKLKAERAELDAELEAENVELEAKNAELKAERAEPRREPTRAERKRAVALGREVSLGEGELVAQIVVSDDDATKEADRMVETTRTVGSELMRLFSRQERDSMARSMREWNLDTEENTTYIEVLIAMKNLVNDTDPVNQEPVETLNDLAMAHELSNDFTWHPTSSSRPGRVGRPPTTRPMLLAVATKKLALQGGTYLRLFVLATRCTRVAKVSREVEDRWRSWLVWCMSELKDDRATFQHQHIVNELARWLGCTAENEHSASTESERHFWHERMNVEVADGVEVERRSHSWDVKFMSLPVTSHDKQHVLEDMFAHAMDAFASDTGPSNFKVREELKTLPKTLLVKLDRQVPTGLPAPHPVIDPVPCDAPVAFPEQIDFGKDSGFSKPLNKHCPREQYNLVAILAGRNVREANDETKYIEMRAYVFSHAQDQWFLMCRDGSSRCATVPIFYSEVASIMNGDSSSCYPLSLYYQQAEPEAERAQPSRDERKREVVLERAAIEPIGDLSSEELVARFGRAGCDRVETIKAVFEKEFGTNVEFEYCHELREADRPEPPPLNRESTDGAESADAKERERLRVALEKRVAARMHQMGDDFGCNDSPAFHSTFSKLVMDRFVRKDIKDLKALVGKDTACFCSALRAEIETVLDVMGPSLEQCADVGLIFDPDFDARKWHRYRAGHILTGIATRARASRPKPPPPPPNRRVESVDQRRLKAERDAEAAAEALVRREAEERVADERKRAEKARKRKELAQRKAEAGRGAKEAAAAQRREQEAARAAERAATVEAKRAAHARALEATKAAREREEAAKFAQALAAKEARERERTEAVRAAQREALREHRRAAACSDLMAQLELEDAPPPTPAKVAEPRPRARGRGAGRGGRGGRGAGRGAPSPEEEDDHKLCVVCMDNDKSHVCTPCGHRCLCAVCAAENKPSSCPICRADVDAVVFLKCVFD